MSGLRASAPAPRSRLVHPTLVAGLVPFPTNRKAVEDRYLDEAA